MYSGLIDECLSICNEILKRFGNKKKENENIKELVIHFKGFLLIIKGQIAPVLEMLRQEDKLDFDTREIIEKIQNF